MNAPADIRVCYLISLSGLSDAETARRQAVVTAASPPGVVATVETLPSGPAFLDAAAHFGELVDATVAHVATISPERTDVIVLAGALDPGLDQVRAAAKVPVVGPGESALFAAAVIGKPTAIVTVDEHAVAAAQQWVERVPVLPPMVAIRSMDMPVRQIVADLDSGRAALRRAVTAAVREDGAETIVLGAMTLPTLGVTASMRHDLRVAILDPLYIALTVARECGAAKGLRG